MKTSKPLYVSLSLGLTSIMLVSCTDTKYTPSADTLYSPTLYTKDTSKKAFSHPISGLDHNETDEWMLGKSFFRIPWVEAPSATTARDGLGPLFSANTCMHCHPNNGAGVAVDDSNQLRRDLVLRLTYPHHDTYMPDPHYGKQLSVNGTHNTPFEGKPKVTYVEREGNYPDGTPYTLRTPTYHIEQLNYGPLHPDTVIAPRIALALVGLGLVEQIPEGDILAQEDPQDHNDDGISGKANWVTVPHKEGTYLGRFTWKASAPTVRFQSANAASNDMGLTTPLFPKENCTPSQTECLEADKGRYDFDIPADRLDAINYYLTHLKVPQPRLFKAKENAEKLFDTLHCNRCHTTSYTLPSKESIAPFSDFLLHDMGSELADNHPDGLATGQEWRTPPLWGIGLYKAVSGEANYLHDGRARSIEEAILWHGGEATGAKNAFMQLDATQRQLLLDYLETL